VLPLNWVRPPEAGVLTAGNGLDWRRTWALWLTLAVLWLGNFAITGQLAGEITNFASAHRVGLAGE
jgi:hypothetical protein